MRIVGRKLFQTVSFDGSADIAHSSLCKLLIESTGSAIEQLVKLTLANDALKPPDHETGYVAAILRHLGVKQFIEVDM